MPDWMSHLLIGLIFCELFNVRKKSLVLLGTLMPDLISKFFLLFFYLGFWNGVTLDSFHTPLLCFLSGILIAPLFRYDMVKTVFLISIGWVTHFLFDLTMRHFTVGIRLFFPFSMNDYKLGLIWPEQSIYVLIAFFVIYVFIKVARKIDFMGNKHAKSKWGYRDLNSDQSVSPFHRLSTHRSSYWSRSY